MAHFAKISENNEVLTVLTLDNKDMLNADGVEIESIGQAYLEQHNNWPANLWIQTSINTAANVHKNGGTAFRGNYAGVGYSWDSTNSIFWPSKIYESWVKDVSSATWKSPLGDASDLTSEQTSQNNNGTHKWVYSWDESAYQSDNSTGWVLVDLKA